MSVPTHGPQCSGVTFKTTCRDCGSQVYYFGCNCGSKVFFEHLGRPWPQHSNTCLPYLVRLNLEEGHRSLEEIRALIADTAEVLGVPIPPRVERLLYFAETVRNNRLKLLNITPRGGISEIFGVVVDVTPQVNMFRHFHLDDGPVGRALLDLLATTPMARITVREEPTSDNNCHQFEVFIPRQKLSECALRVNAGVHLSVGVRSIVGRTSIWFGTSIERQ